MTARTHIPCVIRLAKALRFAKIASQFVEISIATEIFWTFSSNFQVTREQPNEGRKYNAAKCKHQ